MCRKLRLHQRKYFDKLQRYKNKTLQVSLPISVYYNEKTHNLQQLQERVDTLELPTGWVQQPNRIDETIVFTTLISTTVIMVVKINESLYVELKCDGHQINLHNSSQTLRYLKKIESIHDLHNVLTNIITHNMCKGNSAEDFSEILGDETTWHTTVRMGK